MSEEDILDLAQKGINKNNIKKLKDKEVGEAYHQTLQVFDKLMLQPPEDSDVSMDVKEGVFNLLNMFRDELLWREGARFMQLSTFDGPVLFNLN